jgi:hypothetical protein
MFLMWLKIDLYQREIQNYSNKKEHKNFVESILYDLVFYESDLIANRFTNG